MQETAFLVGCLARYFTPDSQLPSIAGLDWDRLLNLAQKHAVAPLLYATLQEHFVTPPPVIECLRANAQGIARFNLMLSAELVRLLARFEREGIDVLPLKGPTLSTALYGDLCARTFADLDLLIRRNDVLRVKTLIEADGYRLVTVLHWPASVACLKARESELSFLNSAGLVMVDVHWRILPDYFPVTFDADQLWVTSRRVPFGRAKGLALSPEQLVLFLCAHGTKHLWLRLGWICDLARLLQVETGIDWPFVLAQARRTGTLRMLSLGFLLATELLGVELPPMVKPLVTDRQARVLARTITERMMTDAPIPATAWQMGLMSLRAMSRTRHRLAFALGSLRPSEAEYRAMQLPPALYGLYFPFRPLRLTAKYARRLTGL